MRPNKIHKTEDHEDSDIHLDDTECDILLKDTSSTIETELCEVSSDITSHQGDDKSESETQPQTVKRIAPNDIAPFMKGKIWGQEIDILVDTGATVTVLSERVFNSLPADIQEKKQPAYASLKTASGNGINITGRLKTSLQFGTRAFPWTCVIAKIDDDAILGMDFIRKYKCAIQMDGDGFLQFEDQKIEFQMKTDLDTRCCRIQMAESVTIPGWSEVVFPGKLVEPKNLAGEAVLTPLNQFHHRYPVRMASTVIDLENGVPLLRMANLSDETLTLHKNTNVGLCRPLEKIVYESITDGDARDYMEKTRQLSIQPSAVGQTTGQTDEVKLAEMPEHLQNLWERSSKQLDDPQKQELKHLLIMNADVFSKNDQDLGRTDIVQHSIDTGDTRPIKQAPRRLPQVHQEEADRQVKDMLNRGVIKPSQSPWASPIVLVKKKDGSTRFCVDYRKLNAVTVRDAYPLPRIDDSIDCLSGSKWFSTLDLSSGYWQVGMKEEDKPKTAFVTRSGLFHFEVMSFGLTNAPSTFERLMELVLAGLQWKLCLLYLDDIIIFAPDFSEHIQRLQRVFDCLREANLRLKPKKCELFKKQVLYLGHVVSEDGVSTDPEKVTRVQNWATPTSAKDLRSFLGLVAYYRRFIEGCSRIARPLHKLTEKEADFEWTSECEEAFQQLKTKLTTAPILAYPTRDGHFILDTDASDFAIGSVLSQVQNGIEKVIGYASSTLNRHERNYCTTRKEMLAVVNFVKYYRHYLMGRTFTVRTDHASLKWLKNFKDPDGQIARWISTLDTYDMIIEHRSGKSHGNADALSRIPEGDADDNSQNVERMRVITRSQMKSEQSGGSETPVSTTASISESETRLPMSQTLHSKLSEQQLADKELSVVIAWLKTGKRPSRESISIHSNWVKSLWSQWETLVYQDSILRRRHHSVTGQDPSLQIVIPKSMRAMVLELLHDSNTGGHLGISRTLANVQNLYYWPGMTQDVKDWCNGCEVCQRATMPHIRTRTPLMQSHVGEPLEKVALDLTGPFPETERGNRYLLVIGDHFTKWTEAIPLPNITAVSVAQAFVEHFICRFGVPLEILTDQGRQFESELFRELCQYLEIDKTRTSPWRPQTNGMIERFNRTVVQMLKKCIRSDQRDWDTRVPCLMMAYRCSVHDSTKQSPCRMMLGHQLRRPVDLVVGGFNLAVTPSGEINRAKQCSEYVQMLVQNLANAHDQARQQLKISAERQKRNHDRKVAGNDLQVDQKVLLYQPQKKKGLNPKLQQWWKGPFTVEQRIGDLNYKIERMGKRFVVHRERLKPFHVRSNDEEDK